ncbi:MFS transporter [Amycolatopsis sp. H6(2020)]|nr:MFS transporter [Amycolatopsis sp. H6(2020)]
MSTWRQVPPSARALLVAVLATGLTTFMFVPLLAIELTAHGVPAGRAGLLVGALSFAGQGFSLITGLLVDRFGSKPVLAAGFGLRVAGYVLLGFGRADHPVLLVAGIGAIGVGGSLLGLAIKTMLVSGSGVPARTMLALRATFVNIGVIAGPALGAVVYPLGFEYILAACVLSHVVLGVRLLATPGARRAASTVAEAAPGTAWRWWQWGTLFGLGVAYWAIYAQLNVVVPLAAQALTGSAAAISVVFTLNGALVVVCQYTVLRHLFRRTAGRTLLVLGFLAFALAYAVMVPQAGWVSLLLFVVPVTAAEMLVGPSLDEQAITASSRRRTGSALGVLSAAGACGSLLGAGSGGGLVQAFGIVGTLWLPIIGVSVVAAAACFLLPKKDQDAEDVVHSSPAQPA